MGAVLRLTLFVREIVEAILDGQQPAELQLDEVLTGFPLEWGRAVASGRLAVEKSKAHAEVSELGGRRPMSVYEAIETAMHGKDPEKYIGLLHDDFQFVRHQSGTTLDKAAMADMIRRMAASSGMAVQDQRCLYENGDIVVEHSVMDFPDGTREAVMAVHMLKDGKIIRTETGATPVSK